MNSSSPSFSQIRAQVRSIHQSRPQDRVIGIKTSGKWQEAERVQIDGEEYLFSWCNSVLQIRELLVEQHDRSLLVILTNLNQDDLGQDLLARFARRKLFTINTWQILLEHFQARMPDPTLGKNRWLADILIENIPPQGYPPAPNGVLEAETVWGIVLKNQFGFASARPDTRELLEWTLSQANIDRYMNSPPEARQGLRAWIIQSAGAAGEVIFDCIDAGYGEDALPLGLACQVVFSEDAETIVKNELQLAAVRMERFTGGHSISENQAKGWKNAAISLIEKLSPEGPEKETSHLLERMDRTLADLKIDSYAWLSTHSPAGFEAALERFGKRLLELLKAKPREIPEDLSQSAETIFKHDQARLSRERSTKVEMSLRLLRWLIHRQVDEISQPNSFDEAAMAYALDGGFVDRARYSLYRGERVSILSEAYARLVEIVTVYREVENKRFADLLAGWIEAGAPSNNVILGVEDILSELVVGVARSTPILLIVIDGMGYAVFRELLEDITSQGWFEVVPENVQWPRPVIAALPSITEVSRTSLLCGRLTKGTSTNEISGFESHGELRKVTKPGHPPVLFHKSRLTEPGSSELTAEVRQELASEKRRIVGVVVNAVDDHLLKGDQLIVPWNLKYLPLLEHLLYAARDAGRAVIITSDHGHVIERQTAYRQPADQSAAGERYRGPEGPLQDDELLVSGNRILQGTIVAPWSEQVRYGVKKHGYHGGLTPQECVVPFCLLFRYQQELEGWNKISSYQPLWWSRLEPSSMVPASTMSVPAKVSAKRTSKASLSKMPLFDAPEEKEPETWVEELLASQVFANQIKLAGRLAPKPDDVRKFLSFLAARNGIVLKSALAQRLGYPELRVSGLAAAMRRTLNVDGYAVLEVDEAASTIRLNLDLLKTQFELES